MALFHTLNFAMPANLVRPTVAVRSKLTALYVMRGFACLLRHGSPARQSCVDVTGRAPSSRRSAASARNAMLAPAGPRAEHEAAHDAVGDASLDRALIGADDDVVGGAVVVHVNVDVELVDRSRSTSGCAC